MNIHICLHPYMYTWYYYLCCLCSIMYAIALSIAQHDTKVKSPGSAVQVDPVRSPCFWVAGRNHRCRHAGHGHARHPYARQSVGCAGIAQGWPGSRGRHGKGPRGKKNIDTSKNWQHWKRISANILVGRLVDRLQILKSAMKMGMYWIHRAHQKHLQAKRTGIELSRKQTTWWGMAGRAKTQRIAKIGMVLLCFARLNYVESRWIVRTS